MDALVLVREYMHEAPDPDETVVAHGRARMRITPAFLNASEAPVTVASSPHQFRLRLVASVVVTAALVAGAAIFVAAGSSPDTGKGSTALHLAGYSFALPGAYKLTADTLATCWPVAVFQVPSDMLASPAAPAIPNVVAGPYTSSQIVSAVTSDGGCVTMALSVPYTPTSASLDPFEVIGSSSVRVGSDQGWLDDASNGPSSPQVNLGVRISIGGGQFRDLVVGSKGLSASTLVEIVARGLPS
jgi:hypothetical protein